MLTGSMAEKPREQLTEPTQAECARQLCRGKETHQSATDQKSLLSEGPNLYYNKDVR